MPARAAAVRLGLGLLLALAACTGTDTSSRSASDPAEPTAREGPSGAIRAAVVRYHEHYWTCLRAPDACDPARATVPGSAAFDQLSALAGTYAEHGLFVGPEDVGSIDIESTEIDGDRAVVGTCWWVTAVLYLRPQVPGDAPSAQSTTPRSARETYHLVSTGGDEWSIQRADRVGDLTENVNECRARG